MTATRLASFAWIFFLLLGASAASATTYLSISDGDLSDQAAVVSRVKIVSVEPGPVSGMPSTDYLVEVEEVMKGDLPGSTVVVRVPGGVRADGLGLKIWGAPEFQPGDQALLFLEHGPDGNLRILHLMLGAFHAQRSGKAVMAVRDLSEAHRLQRTEGTEPEEPGVRDLERFTAWIADRAAGLRRAADYWRAAPAEAPSKPYEKYTEINATDGVPIRWFKFDSGGSASWRMDPGGQPGLGPEQSVARLQAALAAWSNDPTSTIRYNYSGSTTAKGGLHTPDGVNAVIFNDPGNDIPGTLQCGTGGLLGLGGPFYYTDTRSYRGKSYHEAVEGNVVINDGAECYFANNPSGLEEVFAHELGHSLGFGHSLDDQAVMRATAHNDGRGARLSDDDRLAASVVYGDGSFRPATPPPPPPPPPPASAPLKLTATPASRTQIQIRWANMPEETMALRIECQQKGTFMPLGTVSPEPTGTLVGGFKANTTYSLRLTAIDSAGKTMGLSNVVKVRTRK
ncbi:MAG TPA: matrixin family metalloprotease [Thermoanaerobaculia bacterium]|jgi:hypothetical protein|nr:matrixin family metalloprotease [Thermoanaerobaculia bacterium]